MVNIKKGKVKIEGSIGELLADLAMHVHALNDCMLTEFPAQTARDMILDTVNLGMMSEDELAKNLMSKTIEVLEELRQAMEVQDDGK